jgi:membrane protease YdiL (CAAX protease family)
MAGDGEGLQQRVISFVALFLMGASAALAPHTVLWIRLAPPAAASLVAGYGWLRPGPGAAVAVLGAAISVIAATGIPWQATMPLALGLFYLAGRTRPAVGSLREPIGSVPVWGTVGCAAVTPIALVAWFTLFRPDLSFLTESLPKVGPAALALGALGFALITSFCEELIWRGFIQTRLTALLSHREAIFLQALSFGTAHAHGFPRGLAGVTLAGAWAIGLGWLRTKGGGLLAPMLAHIVADATIAAIVIFSVP